MKSRLAITALIAVGAMMSGTGATLAIGGGSGSDNASVAEYKTVQPKTPEQVLGDQENSPPEDDGVQEVAGVQEEGGEPTDEAQPTQQVAAAGDGGDTLPFTGFLAIPLLIGGVALLATGGVLRHKSRDSA